jgi:hypothetical protein
MSCVFVYNAITLGARLEKGPIIADQQQLHHPGSISTMRLRSRAQSANEWREPVRGIDNCDRRPAGLRNDSQLCSESRSANSALRLKSIK